MRDTFRGPLLALLGGLLVAAVLPAPAAEGTTLIFVRHAEKQGGDDPPLTAEGRARAEELARVLADAQVDAVYASQYRRARQTAAPAAHRLELDVRVVPVEGEIDRYARRFVGELVRAHRGGTVLVAGHSNTVPALLGALGLTPPTIGEQAYDDLFVVSVDGTGAARLIHLHYGKPSGGD